MSETVDSLPSTMGAMTAGGVDVRPDPPCPQVCGTVSIETRKALGYQRLQAHPLHSTPAPMGSEHHYPNIQPSRGESVLSQPLSSTLLGNKSATPSPAVHDGSAQIATQAPESPEKKTKGDLLMHYRTLLVSKVADALQMEAKTPALFATIRL